MGDDHKVPGLVENMSEMHLLELGGAVAQEFSFSEVPPFSHQLRKLSSLGDDDDEMFIQEYSFSKLRYEVPLPTTPKERGKGVASKKVVLNGISGDVRPGEMLALMGPSGSGKTSLLNVLALRVKPKRLSGDIRVNGIRPRKALKRFTGFVFQDDLMLDNLTVRQTIYYSARLRLPQKLGAAACIERTDDLLKLLKLQGCADTKIGSFSQRGVSGGERKRTAIGVELIPAPKMLFLDEPTSGLDASTALAIAVLLKELARMGMLLVCSIHQPRENIFELFDKILLLWQGRTVYFGATKSIVGYFAALGKQVPPYTNMADWLLDLVTLEDKEGRQMGATLADAFTKSEAARPEIAQMSSERALERGASHAKLERASRWRSSFWHQFVVLLERSNKQQQSNMFNMVSIGQTLGVGAIAGALWFRSKSVDDVQGVLFFVLLQQSFTILNAVIRIFPAERNLMVRERSTGSYRVGAYFLAKTCSDFMTSYFFPLIFATCVYFCAGLRTNPWWSFPAYLFNFLSSIITAQSMGLVISAAVPDFAISSSITFVTTLLLMLFGGFYVQHDHIPLAFQWVKYCSFLFWGYGNFITIQFRDSTVPCSFSRPDEYGTGCPIEGNSVVADRGFERRSIVEGYVMLWLFTFVFRLASYLCLRFYAKLRI